MFFSEAIALIEPKLCINHWKVLYKLCVFYVDRNSKMTTTAGHSFHIGPIGSFYNQVNDTGSWEPLVSIMRSKVSHLGRKWQKGLKMIKVSAVLMEINIRASTINLCFCKWWFDTGRINILQFTLKTWGTKVLLIVQNLPIKKLNIWNSILIGSFFFKYESHTRKLDKCKN